MNIVLELDNVDTPNIIPYSRNQTTVRIEGPKGAVYVEDVSL